MRVRCLSAAFLTILLCACEEEVSSVDAMAGGAYAVSVTGFDPDSRERAVEGFASMTGRDVEEARSVIDGLEETKQLIGFGLTEAEAEWVQGRLAQSGLVAEIVISEDPEPGKRARAAGAGVPEGLRAHLEDQ